MNNKTIAVVVLVLVLILAAVAYSQMGINKTKIDINYKNDPATSNINIPDARNTNEESNETTDVKVYFHKVSESSTACADVSAVTRTIPKTDGVAKTAIEELLKGPTRKDTDQGMITSIPEGTKLQKLEVRNGTAYADFNETLDRNVSGSCLVTSIRSEIENTLKQFPGINDVVISINGESDAVLQP